MASAWGLWDFKASVWCVFLSHFFGIFQLFCGWKLDCLKSFLSLVNGKFWEQKITPKKQSWSPRHVEKMMHYTSQKIAPFQALISSKLHSVQSWHLFCQPKTVSFTNPQVHGPPNPLLYRELDCIQIVIWLAQAILGLFTDLYPLVGMFAATKRLQLF